MSFRIKRTILKISMGFHLFKTIKINPKKKLIVNNFQGRGLQKKIGRWQIKEETKII